MAIRPNWGNDPRFHRECLAHAEKYAQQRARQLNDDIANASDEILGFVGELLSEAAEPRPLRWIFTLDTTDGLLESIPCWWRRARRILYERRDLSGTALLRLPEERQHEIYRLMNSIFLRLRIEQDLRDHRRGAKEEEAAEAAQLEAHEKEYERDPWPAQVIRINVQTMLDPPPRDRTGVEPPEPLDEQGLEALREELERQIEVVSERIRRERLAVVESGEEAVVS